MEKLLNLKDNVGDIVEHKEVKYLVIRDYTSDLLTLVRIHDFKLMAFSTTIHEDIMEHGNYKIVGEVDQTKLY